MIRNALIAAILAATATAASAESIDLTKPMQGMSLHTGGVDMVVYYLDHEDHYEVVATYAPRAAMDEPARLRMGLKDGDATRFGLPGLRGVTYGFSREGETVRVTAETAAIRMANAAE